MPKWLGAFLFGLAYFALAWLSDILSIKPNAFAAFWLPSGLYVGSLLICRTRTWPLLVAAGVSANIAFDLMHGRPLPLTFLFACGNSLEALAGAWLVRRFIADRPVMENLREVMGLAGLSAVLSAAIGAAFGAFALWAAGGLPWNTTQFFLWWGADALGIMLLGPMILSWSAWLRRPAWKLSPGLAADVALFVGVCLLDVFVMVDRWHRGFSVRYLLIPAVVAAAVRLGVRKSSAVCLALAIIAALLATGGQVFPTTSPEALRTQFVSLYLYLVVVTFSGLTAAVVWNERKQREKALRASEEKFAKIFRRAPVIMTISEIEDGTYLDVNDCYTNVSGLAREEVIGRTSVAVGRFTAEERQHFVNDLKKHGQLTDTELSLRTKAGRQTDCLYRWEVINLDGKDRLLSIGVDITERKRQQAEREATLTILRLANGEGDSGFLISAVTDFLQEWSGCQAVGVRIRSGNDFPYFENRGFPEDFVRAENSLCLMGADGQPAIDGSGNPALECMCGNILCGRFDPSKPFFTRHGSFWTNSTTKLLAGTSEADRQSRTRNRCNGEGYESVALIPLRHGQTTFGLLQFNDKRPDRFTPELLELLERLGDNLAIALAQRQAEESLRKSDAALRKAQQVAHVGSWAWHIQSNRLEWSDEMYRIFGIDKAEFTGDLKDVIARAIHPDDRARVEEANLRVIREKDPVPLEYRVIRPDQTVRVVWAEAGELILDEAGNAALLTGIVQDITVHKRAAEALHKSEEKFRSLFNNAEVGMFRTRLDGSEILDMNEKFLSIFGWTLEEMRGKPSVIHWVDPREREEMVRRLKSEGRVSQLECRMMTRDGQVRHCLTSLWLYAEQEILEGSIIDITDRKQAEARLLEYQDQLRELSGRLATAQEEERRRIAIDFHDQIGQNIAALRMSLQLLRRAGLPPESSEVLEEGLSLLKQMGEDSRTLSFALCPPLLYELGLEPALAHLAESFSRQHAIIVRVENGQSSAPLKGQLASALYQAMRELLWNTARHAKASKISVRIARSAEQIRIEVEDDGRGFDPDSLDQTGRKENSFGLFGIRERLRPFDGSLDIAPKPSGTLVTMTAKVG